PTAGENSPILAIAADTECCSAECLLLAQSRHPDTLIQCPLLGVKRTSLRHVAMSAFDPKRTSAVPTPDPSQPARLTRYDAHPEASGAAMRRRKFITLLGGVAAAWPLVGRAQQAKLPTIGVLVLGSPPPEAFLKGLRDALRDVGYTEGQNIRLDI